MGDSGWGSGVVHDMGVRMCLQDGKVISWDCSSLRDPCRSHPVDPVCSLKDEAWVTVVPHPQDNVFPILANLGLDMGWDMTRLNIRVTFSGACPVLT